MKKKKQNKEYESFNEEQLGIFFLDLFMALSEFYNDRNNDLSDFCYQSGCSIARVILERENKTKKSLKNGKK